MLVPAGAPSGSADINSRHPLSVKLLLNLRFTMAQAKHWARQVSVREICAAAGAAEEARARDPGGYVHSLLKGGHKRDAELSFSRAAELRDAMIGMDKLYAIGGAGSDPFDFAARVGSTGTLLAVPQALRASR